MLSCDLIEKVGDPEMETFQRSSSSGGGGVLLEVVEESLELREELILVVFFGGDALQQPVKERAGAVFLAAAFQVDRRIADLRPDLQLAQQACFPHPGRAEEERSGGPLSCCALQELLEPGEEFLSSNEDRREGRQ